MSQPTIGAQASRLARDHTLLGSTATRMPKLIYGTAWKKDKTADLVYTAIRAGFRGIDTAAQPKHYQEAGVASGVRRAIAENIVTRDDLFIQTKFTAPGGQNEFAPYDFNAPLTEKVHQSIKSSLKNFTVEEGKEPYLDSVVLHSPMRTLAATKEAWQVLESYVPKHIRSLGISNTDIESYQMLVEEGSVKPAVVQNRFYMDTEYEADLREMCRDDGSVFQGFWTILPNRRLTSSKPVRDVATNAAVEPIAAYYALILGLGGASVLDGTSNAEHMRQDLQGLEAVGAWAEGVGIAEWQEALSEFKKLVDGASP